MYLHWYMKNCCLKLDYFLFGEWLTATPQLSSFSKPPSKAKDTAISVNWKISADGSEFKTTSHKTTLSYILCCIKTNTVLRLVRVFDKKSNFEDLLFFFCKSAHVFLLFCGFGSSQYGLAESRQKVHIK